MHTSMSALTSISWSMSADQSIALLKQAPPPDFVMCACVGPVSSHMPSNAGGYLDMY